MKLFYSDFMISLWLVCIFGNLLPSNNSLAGGYLLMWDPSLAQTLPLVGLLHKQDLSLKFSVNTPITEVTFLPCYVEHYGVFLAAGIGAYSRWCFQAFLCEGKNWKHKLRCYFSTPDKGPCEPLWPLSGLSVVCTDAAFCLTENKEWTNPPTPTNNNSIVANAALVKDAGLTSTEAAHTSHSTSFSYGIHLHEICWWKST